MFNMALLGAGKKFKYPYDIDYSCRFYSTNGDHLYRQPVSSGDRKKWTVSMWVRRTEFAGADHLFCAGNGSTFTGAYFGTDDKLYFGCYNGTWYRLITTQVFRDPTAWYHFVFVFDVANATSADRLKLYINGARCTEHSYSAPTNANWYWNASGLYHYINRYCISTSQYGNTYKAEFVHVEGQALGTDSFGTTKQGIWVPKKYTGTYGDFGFYLDFADDSDLGNDVSGEGNDFTSSGLDSDDQVPDTPTNTYAILNYLDWLDCTAAPTVSAIQEGALRIYGENQRGCGCTIPLPKTGKWFWAAKWTGGAYPQFGLGCERFPSAGSDIGIYGYYNNLWLADGTNGGLNHEFDSGEWFLMAVDCDNNKIWLGNYDGSTIIWIGGGNPAAGTDPTFSGSGGGGQKATTFDIDSDLWQPVAGSSNDGSVLTFDFGQHGFPITVPTGFKALCRANLSEPSLIDCSKAFDIVTRTGTGAEANITGVGHLCSDNEMVWIKNRDQADYHNIVDTLRGATKEIPTNQTDAESTDANGVTSFNYDGITLGSGAGGYNDNGEDFVNWFFNMVPKYGMDMVTYTGDANNGHTISHNLGAIPEMYIVRRLNSAGNWYVYHHCAKNKTDPETDYGIFNTSGGWADGPLWSDTAPTTTQFTLGNSTSVNANGGTYIAYLFRSIDGLMKIGAYDGNNNSNGTYIYTGFRPRFLIAKGVDIAGNWVMHDSERNGFYNPVDNHLLVDAANAEAVDSTYDVDFLANGFKWRNSYGNCNSTYYYVYIAFAEQPAKYSNAF